MYQEATYASRTIAFLPWVNTRFGDLLARITGSVVVPLRKRRQTVHAVAQTGGF